MIRSYTAIEHTCASAFMGEREMLTFNNVGILSTLPPNEYEWEY